MEGSRVLALMLREASFSKTLDGTYVLDLVGAHVKALEKALPHKAGIFNVGTGQLDEGVCGTLHEGGSGRLLGKKSMKLRSGVQPSKHDQKGAKLDS
ncbi:unnamed protein product [Brassica rapa]|uniref:NAD-dependent epimerase/dehydratase domain-containing protein n=1 Tax=Brassica campestris TaxID=3711 RepID=A0A3P5YWF6_BRACM|nr:unnamed protein product [Brassica rapa]VDC72107.1 unnamed protein product [Brassica rapa]